jgi:hypothetical protein
MTCSEPVAQRPPDDWKHIELYRDVREALSSIPTYFHTETSIEGISATDIFTLSSALGATIESQVVATLNQMRAVWDPDEKYQLYSFVRQSQTFPDVLLRKSSATTTEEEDIILGIELKGWYLLAKEREPSFRFQATAAACAVQDLIVVVPWVLSNVISGTPKLFAPYIESAKYAAEYRNYHWSVLRDTTSAKGIKSPDCVSPYPTKSDQISDKPEYDSGSNFGRFARTGIMDHYLARVRQEELCGIRAEHWLSFFKIFQEKTGDEDIRSALGRLRDRAQAAEDSDSDNSRTESILSIIEALEGLLDAE